MFLIVLFFLALSSVILLLMRRDRQTFLILGLCFSFICMYVGIMIYLAKTGGMSPPQKRLLFLDTDIQRWLSYLAVPLKPLGYLIAMGRYLFPAFLLFAGLNYSMDPRIIRRRRLAWMFLVLPAVSLGLYYPSVFLGLAKGHNLIWQRLLMRASAAWILLYVLAGAALIVHEYRSITIPYCKRQFRFIMLFILSLALMYLIYCVQDPVQVYQMYSAEYMRVIGRFYIQYMGAAMGMWGLVLLGAATMAFTVVGFWSLRTYTLLDKEESLGEISIQRKFDTASMGISVFVHSIKNQLLSNRVLYKKMWKELEEPEPDIGRLKACTEALENVNKSMLGRMEELYKSVKSNTISLSPIPASEVVKEGLARFARKYPDAEVVQRLETSDYVLADKGHLGEALYNLLTNAHEAFQASEKGEERLEIRTHNERLYVRFEVRDNGKGMSKSEQRKIFDPFYTSKNTNFNWGMGLYYVRQIVKSHLGMLKIESGEGEGTTFYLMIPRYAPKEEKRVRP